MPVTGIVAAFWCPVYIVLCQTRQYVQKIIKPGIALIDLWYVVVVYERFLFLTSSCIWLSNNSGLCYNKNILVWTVNAFKVIVDAGKSWEILGKCVWNFVNIRVRTILVLGYQVLADTGRYWGGSIFFWLWHPIPITNIRSRHAACRCLLSKQQSNSSRRRAVATVQRSRFATKQQWQGEWGGVGAPVEQSPFMRDWKD